MTVNDQLVQDISREVSSRLSNTEQLTVTVSPVDYKNVEHFLSGSFIITVVADKNLQSGKFEVR